MNRNLLQLRQLQSRRMRDWWANATPIERTKRIEAIRAACQTPEHRERMRTNRITGGRLGREDKKTIRASTSPTVPDLHWAAGFLEGDGSFQPNRNSGMVSAAQVNREPLTKLQKMFGGSIKKTIRRNLNHSNFHVWQVSGPRARGVMMTLYILMSGRRQSQIDVALGLVGS